jgi:hypothetical protein
VRSLWELRDFFGIIWRFVQAVAFSQESHRLGIRQKLAMSPREKTWAAGFDLSPRRKEDEKRKQ